MSDPAASRCVSLQDEQTLILQCHLQPGAKKDEIVGTHGDALKIKISAPPIDGRANQQLVRFLAKLCRVKQQDVQILAGESSRQKRIRVQNLTDIPKLLKPYI
ncbi:uncharacterized conserved protein [Hahella chejuensis KCTC 2396]|uniref:UPF0235 protein HCH_06357 n=1 Tax=Hahella chejuensis (strain KCTC 2396) TaxID=349521 RepID=Q2S8M2_HAHCH|nr:DUF167 family protein [Hahella chejuensis]ABC33002.1 uncharacterized conserved protein [Hahella chejuensis KCTC 2396]